MSIETVCPQCGAEYDTRHDRCPACTVHVECREKTPPYKTWAAVGYLPFEMYGERFAVTRNPAATVANAPAWRVSHVETGTAVPKSDAETPQKAKEYGEKKLQEAGKIRFLEALQRIKDLIASAK